MKLKTLLGTAAFALFGGIGGAALAGEDSCVIGCAPSTTIGGTGAFGGIVDSVWSGQSGSNDIFKDGGSDVTINANDGGFCGDDCAETTLNSMVTAWEVGNAQTTAHGDTSGETVGIANFGDLQAQSRLDIGVGGNSPQTTTAASFGRALFGNEGQVTATGHDVMTAIDSWGYGDVQTDVGTDGDLCPTCVDVIGGASGIAGAGMTITSSATGGGSGETLSIQNFGRSESRVGLGTDFMSSVND